jgi:Leucine-rich repeat (LRR) protein
LSALLWLDLSSNRLVAIPATQPLTGLTSLQNLILTGNQLSDLSGLSGLNQLLFLDLSFNQMTTLPTLSGLPSLNYLVLSDNELTAFPALGGLPSLQTLYLSTNQITDLSNITTVPSLRWLYLAGNNLQVINPLESANLYYVDLTYNLLNTSPDSQASAVLHQLANNGVNAVYIPQQAATLPTLTLPLRLGGGQFQFTINSPPGQVFQVQVSTNLATWTLLRSVTNNTGVLTFTDSSAAGTHQFYRLFMP